VVWLDHRGKVLTLNERRIMSDERISVERPYTKDWNLFVRSVRPTDAGTYMCQVNTNPVKVQHITLHVHDLSLLIVPRQSAVQVAFQGPQFLVDKGRSLLVRYSVDGAFRCGQLQAGFAIGAIFSKVVVLVMTHLSGRGVDYAVIVACEGASDWPRFEGKKRGILGREIVVVQGMGSVFDEFGRAGLRTPPHNASSARKDCQECTAKDFSSLPTATVDLRRGLFERAAVNLAVLTRALPHHIPSNSAPRAGRWQEPAKIIDHLSSNEYVVAKEGDTVELVCNVTGQPHPTVTWHRIPTGLMHDNDQREEKQIGVEGEVLVIHNVTRYCDDLYKCVAYNNVKPAAHRDIRVYVEFPPEIRLPNRKLGQSKGKTTILECIVTAYPHAFNVWRRHGKDITRNSKYNIEVYDEDDNTLTLSLRIQSLTEEDYGKYECVSENPLGRDSETMILYGYNVPTQWPHSGDNNALPNNEGKSWPDPRFPDAENPDNIARPNVEGGENRQRSPSVIVEPNSKANQLMWNSGCVLLIATSLTAVLIGR
ncbi:hypothetical protein BaRGS_00005169, partial [Batillaria attramentaria]